MKLAALFFGLLLCCLQSTTSEYADDEFDDYVPFIGLRRDDFDWKLMQAIVQNDSSNVVVSSFSVKAILMMLAEMSGLGSNTRKELLGTLGNIKDVHEGRVLYKKYLASLLNFDLDNVDNDIRCGQSVIISDKLLTSQKIGAILETNYLASVNKTNLQDIPGTTQQINGWVRYLTNNRIQSLVTEEQVANTVVMLLNVLYFEGRWKKPFKTEATVQGPFETLQGRANVEYMKDVGEYYYFESKKLNSKILRLPYTGRKYAMFVILPNRGQTLQSVAPLLNHKAINREAWYLDEQTVDLRFPKFSMNYGIDLKPYLIDLGVNDIFTQNASLPLLVRGSQLQGTHLLVSSILQKTAIEVNEEGTIAAAATQAQLVDKIDKGVQQFHADRPFLFYIEDESTGNIIFSGQVTDPSLRN